ncbi:hypothetical protein APHAL10511_000391 [Amanita phalloides]|nr:hypothetical protein APHAL10511_000391 [Amanita phalloides]
MRAYTISHDGPLSLDPEELAFFKAQTKIADEEELKKHITDIQTRAYKATAYPYVKAFGFTKLWLSRVPAYQRTLKVAEERKDAIFLDVGCCFGTDIRKAVADGWPVHNVVGFDLVKEYWDYGHDLFRTTPETFPATFVTGDVVDPAMISLRPPFHVSEALPSRPDLKSLTSLIPLQGHAAVIGVSSLFHLFDEGKQVQIARLLSSLLSPLPGSTILGTQGARLAKSTIIHGGNQSFLHSPESWKDMWYGVFEKGTIHADVDLVEVSVTRSGKVEPEKHDWMIWSVTRL